MDRLVIIVDALNDVFQIMLAHGEYLVPLVAMRRDDYIGFMETCRKVYMKYEDMTLQNSPVMRDFINTLEGIDVIQR